MTFVYLRKIFHFSAIVLPILYYYTSQVAIVIILIIANFVILTLDINRHYNIKIQYLVDKFFKPIMKEGEYSGSKSLSGMSYMFLAFLLTAIFFQVHKVIISWLILVVSDSSASLIGEKYGTKTRYGKSFLGSAVFFLSAFVVYLISSTFLDLHLPFVSTVFAILLTTLAEFYSKSLNIDDNFLVPVVFCLMA